MEYRNYKIVYRRYASLYFIIAVDNTEVGQQSRDSFCVVGRHGYNNIKPPNVSLTGLNPLKHTDVGINTSS